MKNEWEVDRAYGYIYVYITIYKYNEYITILLCRTETQNDRLETAEASCKTMTVPGQCGQMQLGGSGKLLDYKWRTA